MNGGASPPGFPVAHSHRHPHAWFYCHYVKAPPCFDVMTIKAHAWSTPAVCLSPHCCEIAFLAVGYRPAVQARAQPLTSGSNGSGDEKPLPTSGRLEKPPASGRKLSCLETRGLEPRQSRTSVSITTHLPIIYPLIPLSIYPHIHISIYLCNFLVIPMSICLFVPIYFLKYLFIYLYIPIHVYLSLMCLSAYT